MGSSCKKNLKETSKTINGYSQLSPMPRALGFESEYDIQCKLGKYSHTINASDVVAVSYWLFENGFDIIKTK